MLNISNLLKITTLLIIISFSSQAQRYDTPVEHLHDKLEKKRFLISVFHLDQSARDYEDSVMVSAGWRSEAHLMAIDSLHEVDSILSTQIDRYLDLHGFPTSEGFSEIPRITPWLILHHSNKRDIRRKHFPELYEAYQDGDLEQRRLLIMLEDEYELEFKKSFQSYATDEARIGELLKELELMPSKGRKLIRLQ